MTRYIASGERPDLEIQNSKTSWQCDIEKKYLKISTGVAETTLTRQRDLFCFNVGSVV